MKLVNLLQMSLWDKRKSHWSTKSRNDNL